MRARWSRARTRAAAAAVLALAVTSVPGGVGAESAGADAGAEVPVAGRFEYVAGQREGNPVVKGAIHAVRRLDGATVVYYSVGFPRGSETDWLAVMPNKALSDSYDIRDASEVSLVDTANLKVYRPLGDPDCLCSSTTDLEGEAGRLLVGYAVMPELPADVSRVSVRFGYGALVADVPVGQGALPSEGAGGATTTELGKGWPQLPDAARISGVTDQKPFVKDLVRRVADTERTVTQKEQPGKVEVDLAADVLFAVDQATLTPAARSTIAQVAADVARRGKGTVTVTGYTDSDGSDSYNLDLSRRRAQAVLAALQAAAPGAKVTFTAAGRGEADPVADNSTPEGKRLNRRVNVSYQVGEAS